MTAVDNAATLRLLADAVRDLVDGLGGDDQEEDRGNDIARALEAIADGEIVAPLPAHDAARADGQRWSVCDADGLVGTFPTCEAANAYCA